MRVFKLYEGVVHRRGNTLEVGSLKLQLYPDHIFYVVNGGKDADLSIYKDGAFKPTRTNEIYLKDAARHNIPQAFINLFSKFFATNDVDVVVNGLEDLFNKHVKEAELDEGKYNEIFLKGLVGAIMAGGLSLGIDYAKEKTAEYDRQGLQSIYKSIDPREYPQLTKKLTPQDQKGLNAILGKLKEHAMRMEDITEGNKENKAKKNAVVQRPKDKKMSDFDPRVDLKVKESSEPDHEASMAKGELYNACKNAMALMKMIKDGDNLDGWVAAKITKACDYLNSVHDYMAYEKNPMSEEKQRLDPKCWKGYRKSGTKMKGGVRVNNCVKVKK